MTARGLAARGATSRYAVSRAPGELLLTQELLNTAVPHRWPASADLLASPQSARCWLAAVAADWAGEHGGPAPPLELPDAQPDAHRELHELRELRLTVRGLLAEPAQPPGARAELAAPLEVRISGGSARIAPRGVGADWVRSAVSAECLLGHRLGLWPRLKLCRNPRCPIAFYDRSRNNSRVWHDVGTCGNAANMRAYRSRRATAATG